jgi:nitrogen regulatory protein P-II 1
MGRQRDRVGGPASTGDETMKEIKAYIRNSMVNRVVDALAELPDGPTVAVVPLQAFGHGTDSCDYTGVPVTKLEVDVPDEHEDEVVAVIRDTGRTGEGHSGDGRILVSNVDRVVRISDGREGDAVLE